MSIPEKDLKEGNGVPQYEIQSDIYTGKDKSHNKFDTEEPSVTAAFQSEYVRKHKSVLKHRKEWSKVAEELSNPLVDSHWFIAGAKAFCPPNELLMFVIKEKNKLQAIAPLCLKGGFFPHLELLGSSTLMEPGGFAYNDEESLSALIQFMLDEKWPLVLHRFYKTSDEVILLNKQLKTGAFNYETEEDRIPYVNTSGDWDTYEREQFSSSRRSSFRRLHRKAKSEGGISFKVVVPNEENYQKYLEEVYRIEAANWKGRMGTAMKTHPTLSKFFRNFAQLTSEQGRLHFFFLKVGDQNVAVQFTMVYANRLWIYKIGFDEDWAWCSPGILLMNKVVKYCFENDLERCEFLGHDESWLHIWANGFREMISYKIYPKTLTGKLVKLSDRLRANYHKMKAKQEHD